tara:strand:+ start:754 stop:855 length:102 start_codon:yes stop_codon:yes gene_type:complete
MKYVVDIDGTICKEVGADIFIDDKAINVKDFFK